MASLRSDSQIGSWGEKNIKIHIDFDHPYLDENAIFALTLHDLDRFYTEADAVDRLNLFFVLEASLHRFQSEDRLKAAARCAFLMAYYLFVPLTPPASFALAAFYIDRALEWDATPEYSQWKKRIDGGDTVTAASW